MGIYSGREIKRDGNGNLTIDGVSFEKHPNSKTIPWICKDCQRAVVDPYAHKCKKKKKGVRIQHVKERFTFIVD